MRVRIGDHEVEGSAAEVAELLRLLKGTTASRHAVNHSDQAIPALTSTCGISPFVSEEVAVNVLTRLPLADAMKNMLQKLDASGEEWTSAPMLQEALGMSTRSFAGLLGAFGRRVSHTPGTGSRSFLDQYWDHEHGFNLYRLPPSVRAALRTAKIL